MILKIFSVFDNKAEAFARPFFVNTTGAAVRAFSDEANRADSDLCKHPQDFGLFELGEFDDATGLFTMPQAPKHLGLAAMFKENK